jgi:hypothetical protein
MSEHVPPLGIEVSFELDYDGEVDSEYAGVDGEWTPETGDCECCEELSEYNVNMPASNCGEDE